MSNFFLTGDPSTKPRSIPFDPKYYTPTRFGTKPDQRKIVIEYKDEQNQKIYHHNIKLERYCKFEKIQEYIEFGKSLADPFYRTSREFDAHDIEKEIEGIVEDIKSDKRHSEYFNHESIKNDFLPSKNTLLIDSIGEESIQD